MSEVQERPIDKVSAAFAKAQGAFSELKKNRTAEVPLKSGGKYSYKYADLHDVMLSVKEALKENELAITQTITREPNQTQILRSTLVHSSGQTIHCDIPLVAATQGSGPQALGSALTYARRYGVCALLGIVADEDDDGALAEQESQGKASAGKKSTAPVQNKTASPPPQQKSAGTQKPTPKQLSRLFAIAGANKWTNEDVKELLKSQLKKESTKDLLWTEYEKVVEYIQAHPKNNSDFAPGEDNAPF